MLSTVLDHKKTEKSEKVRVFSFFILVKSTECNLNPHPDNLIQYLLNGSISVFSDGDSGAYSEVYGLLKADIGPRELNKNAVLWQIDKSKSYSLPDGTTKLFQFSHYFQEARSFLSAASGQVVTIGGSAKESDNYGDDILGSYDDEQFSAYTLFQSGISKTFIGNSGAQYGFVIIKLKILIV